ncbi:MAG: ATP-binding protein [Chloroflexia bacterium]
MTDACTHLDQIKETTPRSQGCEECVALGDSWVHLRLCLGCGHVGCCDESKNRHATGHFHATQHPIIRSFEPGEDWMWCYVDEALIYPPGDEGEGVKLAVTKEFLRRLPIFGRLADEHLSKLGEIAEPATIRPGELLMEEGSPGDALYIIVDGDFEVTKRAGKSDVVMATRHSGDMLGEMSLLEHVPRLASVRALRDSRVLVISREAFYNLLTNNPAAVLGILRTFIDRLRSTETLLVQHDKLASLGTLAAGLSHELNNPAAAVRRSADQLREALGQWQRVSIDLDRLTFNDVQAARLAELRDEMETRASRTLMLEPLARSDREVEVQEWLEARGAEDAWEIAPVLVSFGWDLVELERALEPFSGEHIPAIAAWLSSGSSAYGLLNEVQSSAQRISEIVKAVKTYSFLDQAPVQQVDIHEGLENTLVMLRHNLKTGVTVKKEYDLNLPRIEGYGSELNQVWTNIIDNAISAMDGHGELTIKTYMQDTNVIVELADNGPGIPPDVQARVFEPFFTTKGPGIGTGLGLHIVYNIIVDKHHGHVKVDSRPGYTCFQITLPIRLAREAQG